MNLPVSGLRPSAMRNLRRLGKMESLSRRRHKKVIEESETKHPLLTNFVAMSEDGLKFWLVKFVAEVRRNDGKPYPPNSLYQICCGLGHCSACCWQIRNHIFNSPGFAMFHATLDSCMKELKATGNFEVKQAEPIRLKIFCGRKGWKIHKHCLTHLYSILACISLWEVARSTCIFATNSHSFIWLSHHEESPI